MQAGSFASIGVALLPCALLFGCSEPGSDATADAESSGSSESGDGEGESSTAVGDAEGSSDGGSSDVESSDEDSADDSSSGSSTGGDALECAPGTALVDLVVDDLHVADEQFAQAVGSGPLGLKVAFGDRGALALRTDTFDIYPTEPVVGAGYLRLADSASQEPSSWYCFDDASEYVTDGESQITASLRGVTPLGACPGEPVEGTIRVCFLGGDCEEQWTLESEIGGQSYISMLADGLFVIGEIGSDTYDATIGVGDSGRETPGGVGGDLAFRVSISDDPAATESAVADGYFIAPLDHPDAGAIYCVGEGSRAVHPSGDPDHPTELELTGLSRLGSCSDAAGEGTAEFCMNMGS